MMGITASRNKELGLVETVLKEPLGGAHRNPAETAQTIKKALIEQLNDLKAKPIEQLLDGRSVYLAFIAIFIITLLMTELITNSAAAALTFPIAYNIAIGLGVDPIPFVMAVAFAASGSFISPYGYQTNLLVFSASNYKFKHFIKFGLPISICYSSIVLTLLNIVYLK